jgi:acetyltransferase-like isoleucine patch superfamily enzyme
VGLSLNARRINLIIGALRLSFRQLAIEMSRIRRLSEFSILNPAVSCSPRVRILGDPKRIHVGAGSVVEEDVILDVRQGGEICLGLNMRLRIGATIATCGGDVVFGDNCGIQQRTIVYGHGGVSAADYVWIAADCIIVPANHGIELSDVPIYEQPLSKKGIRMGSDIWVGSGCCVLDGVSIGSGAVVGAGSIVTRDIPPNTIAGGVPAKMIRSR